MRIAHKEMHEGSSPALEVDFYSLEAHKISRYLIFADAMIQLTKADFVFDSSPTCASYMRQWIGSVLVQIMACRLFGANR